MGTSQRTIAAVAACFAVVAGCGGDDSSTTTVTDTVTVTEQAPKPDKPAQTGASKLRADCTIVLVTRAKRPIAVRKPFFCTEAPVRVMRDLPASPFASGDECRLDVDAGTLYRGGYVGPLRLSETWPRFTAKCTEIRLVVTGMADEETSPYQQDAPQSEGALKPGQKGSLSIP